MTTTLRKGLLATTAAVALSFASAGAQAQTPINGGGSTLAQPYIQSLFAGLNDTSVTFGYAGVGSGAGQAAFIPATGAAQLPAKDNLPASTTIHYATSDAALSQAQIDGWNSTLKASAGNLIQLPTFGTPITFPHFAQQYTFTRDAVKTSPTFGKYTGAGTAATYAKALTLNDADLCGIFSGKITDWSAITGTSSNYLAPSTGKTAIKGPITVVFRTDGSGTSFLLTQHLAAVCTPATSNITFTATKTFASLFPSGTPTNFVGASGSGGVATLLAGTAPGVTPAVPALTSAIGYLSPDYTAVNSTAPVSPQYTSLKVASVINSTTGLAVKPTAGTTKVALSSPSASDSNVNAPNQSATAAANQLAWIPTIANPTAGYPVVGYTTIDLAQCYASPAVASGLTQLVGALYASTAKASLTAAGFAQVPSATGKTITGIFFPAAKLVKGANVNAEGSSASAWSLNIGSVKACTGKTGL